jgi:hypothetical protein
MAGYSKRRRRRVAAAAAGAGRRLDEPRCHTNFGGFLNS